MSATRRRSLEWGVRFPLVLHPRQLSTLPATAGRCGPVVLANDAQGSGAAGQVAPTAGQVLASPDCEALIQFMNHRWRMCTLAQWPENGCVNAQYKPPRIIGGQRIYESCWGTARSR